MMKVAIIIIIIIIIISKVPFDFVHFYYLDNILFKHITFPV